MTAAGPDAPASATVPQSLQGAEPQRRTSRLRSLAGLAVSAIALAAVAWWAARQPAPKFPSSAGNLSLLGLAVVVHSLATLARGWRWHAVLRLSRVQHRAVDAYALTAVGYMGNTVLPARGGEVLRMVLMSRRCGARKREVLGSILAERLLDVAALVVLLVIVTLGGVAGTPVGWVPAIASLGAALALALGLALYLRKRRGGRYEAFARRARPLVLALRAMMGPSGIVLMAVSSAIWLSEGFIFYLVGRSLELSINLPEAAFLVVIGSFFALIPAAPGYVGTYDAAVLFGLKALGISGGASIGFVLLVRFVLFVPVTVVGLILLLTRYGGLATLTDRAGRGPTTT